MNVFNTKVRVKLGLIKLVIQTQKKRSLPIVLSVVKAKKNAL